MYTVRILSCDPGVVNCAFFVADFRVLNNKVVGVKVIDSFMATTTIKTVKDDNRLEFIQYCKKLKRKFKPEIVIIERFIPRGGFLKASIVECVNFMINTMAIVFNVETKLVTAASWKMYYKKHVDLKLLYKVYKHFGPHRIDSILMSVRQYNFNPTKAEMLLQHITKKLK